MQYLNLYKKEKEKKIMSKEIKNNGIITDENYFEDREYITSSMIKRALEGSKKQFDYAMNNSIESEAFLVGSAFHAMMLEPDSYKKLYAFEPNVDRRTKEGKKEGVLGKLQELTPDKDEQIQIIGVAVRLGIVVWSGFCLTLAYIDLPGFPKQTFDPTFIASIFTSTLTTFGVQAASKKG